ncbi:MAG: hypothetical protein FJ070_11335, partial [Cyanobacteria bacterium K_DeepCast_150m_m2_101]|nr:hypothetical protein [Cyanobacteria bacterium K_DeepCast_150m_m2_101]
MASAPPRFGCLSRVAALALLVVGGAALSLLAERPNPQALASSADFVLTPEREQGLFAQLGVGDRAWVPRAEPIPGGGTRYVYQKRPDEQPLTLEQIKALTRDPPTFALERSVIRQLLTQMRHSGVTVLLGPPRKQGAAGEWDPARGVLRIRPDIPSKGSREFARVLNHEAIHVAQSCRNGALSAHPKLLGLSRQVRGAARRHLQEPLYRNSTALERALEEEAYANQDNLQLGVRLITAHCRLG